MGKHTDSNVEFIREMFQELAAGNRRALLSRMAEDSKWIVMGTSPVSKTYFSRQDFYEQALAKITRKLTARVVPKVIEIFGAGDRVLVRWRGEAMAKSGIAYHNDYCWVLTVRENLIVAGDIYADTELITEIFRLDP